MKEELGRPAGEMPVVGRIFTGSPASFSSFIFSPQMLRLFCFFLLQVQGRVIYISISATTAAQLVRGDVYQTPKQAKEDKGDGAAAKKPSSSAAGASNLFSPRVPHLELV